MKKIAILTTAITLLAGCAPHVPKSITLPAFPQSEYESLKLSGNEVLSGQAFLKTLGGDVKVAAGSPVALMPKTSYTDFQFSICSNYTRCEQEDARAAKYEKSTIADGEGRFEFTGIAPGEYYVQTSVTWMRPSRTGLVQEGAALMTKVTVKTGAKNTVVVTK